MQKKKLFKNNVQMIIYTLIFMLCIVLFIVIGKTDFREKEISDAKRFNNMYNLVSEDNVYSFSNATEVLKILNGRSGIILMGFSLNTWTKYTAKILNDVAKEYNVDKIYYYDFLKDREESNGTYETIVNKLSEYVAVDDEGTKDLHAPTVVIVKDGKIIEYCDDTTTIKGVLTPEDYYTEYQINITKEKFEEAIIDYLQ